MSEEIVFNQEKKKSLINLQKLPKKPLLLGLGICVLVVLLVFFLLPLLRGPLTKEKLEKFCKKQSGEFSVEQPKETIYEDDLEGIFICKNSKKKYKLTLTVFKKDFQEVSALDSTISSLKSNNSDSVKVIKNKDSHIKFSKHSADSSSATAGAYYKNTSLTVSAETEKKAVSLLSKLGY